jgi:hypothetical protein
MPQTILPQQQSAHKEFEGLLSDPVIRSKLRKTLEASGFITLPTTCTCPPATSMTR